MRAFRLFRRELGRLLHSRFTWAVVLGTVLSPLAGLTIYRPLYSISSTAYVTTTLGQYLANPALAGGLAGAVLFAILTVWELDRIHRSGLEALVDAAVPPLTASLVRLAAILCAAALTQAVTMAAWLPYTAAAAGAVFDGRTYCQAYLILMAAALPLAVLFASAMYQFTRRLDLSLSLFAVFAGLSLTVWSERWQLCWLNPCVWALSDDFSNDRLFRSVAYMRLTWLAALAGLWCLSYLCIRRYGKGLPGSLARNVRRIYRPLVAAALLACAAAAYVSQPFLDHSVNNDMAGMGYLDNQSVDGWSKLRAKVCPDPATGRVEGVLSCTITYDTPQARETSFLMNPGYTIRAVRIDGQDVPYTIAGEHIQNNDLLSVPLPAAREIALEIEYGGFPTEWNLAESMQGDYEISSQYMRLENAVLAPVPLNVAGLEETVDITLPNGITPIPFGAEEAQLVEENSDGTALWRIELSSPIMILYAGDYIRENIEAAGMNIQFYYARKHRPIMEAAGAADAVKAVVEYCAGHYGPLSFSGGDSFKLIQSRVSGGGYASMGASLLDENDFTAQNLSSQEKGGSAAEVMIHEAVHQWWGMGRMFDMSSPMDPWSSEGLTTYTTYRIVKELYGEEEAQANFVRQWKNAAADYYGNFYVRRPEYLSVLPESFQESIAISMADVRHYNEMPLKILKAERLVGGEEALDDILSGVFNQEPDWSYPYLTYQDFLDACGLTEEDLELTEEDIYAG